MSVFALSSLVGDRVDKLILLLLCGVWTPTQCKTVVYGVQKTTTK